METNELLSHASDVLSLRADDAMRLGSGLLLYGLGGCIKGHHRSCEFALEQTHRTFMSWSYGLDHGQDEVYELLNAQKAHETESEKPEKGSSVQRLRRFLSRPYARRIAGVPVSSFFNARTREFQLTFSPFFGTIPFPLVEENGRPTLVSIALQVRVK